MKTKKHIFGNPLYLPMGDKFNLYKSGLTGKNRLEYEKFLETKRTGNKPFDRFVRLLTDTENRSKELEYFENQKEQDQRINSFVKRHLGLSYSEFVDRSAPENIQASSFLLMQRRDLKRSLFDKRARLYLCALEDYEQEGGNVQDVLDSIREEEVPYVKSYKGREPTFEAIYNAIKGH